MYNAGLTISCSTGVKTESILTAGEIVDRDATAAAVVVQESVVHFGELTGTNVITIPDGLVDALHIIDAGGTEFLRLDTANDYFLIDPVGVGINVGIGIATPEYPVDVAGVLQTDILVLDRGANKTIAAGVITVDHSYFIIDTQDGDPADDLDTINGGIDGMYIRFHTLSGSRDVTVKDGTGNIECSGGDIILNSRVDYCVAWWDSARGKWIAHLINI